MEKLKDKITNVILIGAPVAKIAFTKTKVSIIYAKKDPLSWNVSYNIKQYCAGDFGHLDYFTFGKNKKKGNIDKVVEIIKKIIK